MIQRTSLSSAQLGLGESWVNAREIDLMNIFIIKLRRDSVVLTCPLVLSVVDVTRHSDLMVSWGCCGRSRIDGSNRGQRSRGRHEVGVSGGF